MSPPGHWVGAPSPTSPCYLAEMGSCAMGEGAHLFLSAVWTTTVLTLLLLEGISKGHLVPLGWRVIYSFVIATLYFMRFFFLKNLQQ